MSIFLDANAPMYSAGREHPMKEPSIKVMRLIEETPGTFVTSTEMLQEIVHRYLAIRRWAEGRVLFDRVAALMKGSIQPVYLRDVQQAADLADKHPSVSARDLLHAAVMVRVGATRIISTDTDFDDLPGVKRLNPLLVDEWAHLVTESR